MPTPGATLTQRPELYAPPMPPAPANATRYREWSAGRTAAPKVPVLDVVTVATGVHVVAPTGEVWTVTRYPAAGSPFQLRTPPSVAAPPNVMVLAPASVRVDSTAVSVTGTAATLPTWSKARIWKV